MIYAIFYAHPLSGKYDPFVGTINGASCLAPYKVLSTLMLL
uniref:Uncharacterized protein n=1 Tax=Arundo donax TaxID=35708 RepID=A0A0A8Y523_ARUDO